MVSTLDRRARGTVAVNEDVPLHFRLFIALTIPDEIKAGIEKAQEEMRRALPEGRIRWIRREQFHLTLRFLGEVDAERVPVLLDAVRGACNGFAPLSLRSERVGFFPDGRFPRVLWVGVNDRENNLPLLQRAVQQASAGFTAEKPEQDFSGHITMGRIKRITRPEAKILTRLASDLAERFFGEWTANKIEIMRSELSEQGARHSLVATVPLAAFP